MSASAKNIVLLLGTVFLGACAHLPPEKSADRSFSFETDRLGFANETVWHYENGVPKAQSETETKEGEKYTRRCFVVCRAAVQFWKFAAYDPSKPKLTRPELIRRIREVADIDVWKDPFPESKRVRFPGYANFHDISKAHSKEFRENLGLGWPVYFRIGNVPMLFPPTRGGQKELHDEMIQDLKARHPTIVWLINFPSLGINHAVVIYRAKKLKASTEFTVYDPNYATAPKKLTFDEVSKTFSYQKTFYFQGGPVDVRPLYRSPIQ